MSEVAWLEWLNLLAITINAISLACNFTSALRSRRMTRRLQDRLHDWDLEVHRMANPPILADRAPD